MPVHNDLMHASYIVFDLDGVLVNSIAAIEFAWRTWSEEHGLDSGGILATAHGRRKSECLAMIAPHLEPSREIQRLIRLEDEQMGLVEPIPGAVEFIATLPKYCWAVATSGERHGALLRLEKVGIAVPDVLIAAEDVAAGKPHPEVYLKAAAGLGARPETCVVFEDAPPGILAATAAGMTAIAVTTTYSPSDLSSARAMIRDFRDVRAIIRNGELTGLALLS